MTVTLDINQFINQNNKFIFELNGKVKFIGKKEEIVIGKKYDQLDLSEVKCKRLIYINQEGESIKNHQLPNSLKELDCGNNQLTSQHNFFNEFGSI